MNRKLAALALSGVLLCSMGAPTLAAGNVPPASRVSEETEMEQVQSLPNSVLYYGEVKAILTGADGTITEKSDRAVSGVCSVCWPGCSTVVISVLS